jgi:hypothetical protein
MLMLQVIPTVENSKRLVVEQLCVPLGVLGLLGQLCRVDTSLAERLMSPPELAKSWLIRLGLQLIVPPLVIVSS